MNDARFEELLAGLLGDELTSAERAELDEALAADPARAARARELQATVAVLRSAVGAAEAQPVSAPWTGQRPWIRRRTWPLALLRYAAVIALAFGAGHWVRGRQDTSRSPVPVPGPTNGAVATPAAVVDPLAPGGSGWSPALAQRWTAAAQQYPHASEFSRALLALARH